MGWKLTKAEHKEFDALRDALRTAIDALDLCVNDQHEAADAEAFAAVKQTVAELAAEVESAAEAASEWCQNFYDEKDSAWSDKSEKWQESEKGDAARTWVDEWGNVAGQSLSVHHGIDAPEAFPAQGALCAEVDFSEATDYLDSLDNVPTEAD